MAKKKTANYFITFEAETDDPDIQSILDYFCDLKGQKNEAEYLDSDEFQIGYKKYRVSKVLGGIRECELLRP